MSPAPVHVDLLTACPAVSLGRSRWPRPPPPDLSAHKQTNKRVSNKVTGGFLFSFKRLLNNNGLIITLYDHHCTEWDGKESKEIRIR